ncbi:alpha-1,6-mannosylglycoprotein 6-beta-N-acetylglucosaminyltransferase A-like [Antedon mediterranea]|uniref:alpha-1,6-mannosylglycoprotein 6-beta-N-acetylglucosaminyltransferase A-like n=1 Tax=Antedon mediterranea TaxID=105859 RepID=UPI003AF9C86F
MSRNGVCSRNLTSKNIRIFLMTLMMMWLTCMLMIFQTMKAEPEPRHESERLRDEILEISQKYIQALAVEHSKGDKMSNSLIARDLKQTIATVLDSLIERIDKIEQRLDEVLSNNTFLLSRNLSHILETPGIVSLREYQVRKENKLHMNKKTKANLRKHTAVEDNNMFVGVNQKLPGGSQPNDDLFTKSGCDINLLDLSSYPNCKGKLGWMKHMWKSDKCYALNGVDGSQCSFMRYLSEVESWCPLLSGRVKEQITEDRPINEKAEVRTNINPLMSLLSNSEKFEWIRQRISNMWKSKWLPAAEAFKTKFDNQTRMQKKVLLHLGLLTKESGFKIAENAFHGGPLGELVQWGDIIASMYILGHDMTISISTPSLKSYLKEVGMKGSNCPSKSSSGFQIIYIDIVGLKQFKKSAAALWQRFSCMFRVIDSFGTEPAFNLATYMKKKSIKSVWGKWGLKPKQFFTMFPHTPDNSFMGFVVDQAPSQSSKSPVRKTNDALVYGKKANMWADAHEYIDTIHSKFNIHGTVFRNLSEQKQYLPSYVINHGIVSGQSIQQLLRETKLFVGLGFPYDGPAPLEAIANGCVFLNPMFKPPKNSKNTKFFKDKPTTRELTSQHPYAEVYIGKPYVYTVDITNTTALELALTEIQKQDELAPYLPYEFSCEGMLQRVSVYIQNQNFCDESHWPPKQAMKQIMSKAGQSCKHACSKKGFICEPDFFKYIDNKENFQQNNIPCEEFKSFNEIIAPSFDTESKICYTQSETLLYSCAGYEHGFKRMCPCRDFIKEQIAFCTECV